VRFEGDTTTPACHHLEGDAMSLTEMVAPQSRDTLPSDTVAAMSPAVSVTAIVVGGVVLIVLIALWGVPSDVRAAILSALGSFFESLGRAAAQILNAFTSSHGRRS
jgi:hypothetical protein